MPAPGTLVAWWDGGDLALAVHGGEEKQRIRLVLEGGREERVARGRIAFEVDRGGPVPGRSIEDLRATGKRVTEAAGRVRSRAAGVDVAALWDLALESPGPQDDAALADLALGSASGESRAALVRALLDDAAHFVRKGEAWEPRSKDAVDGILRQRERTAARAAGRQAAGRMFAAAARGETHSATGSEEERKFVAALLDLSVHDIDAKDASKDLAMEALDLAGMRFDRPSEGAFRLLRAIGEFASDDENLQVRRYALRGDFPEEVLEAASQVAARGFRREGRRDLTGIDVITIDGPRTREIDDGISFEPRPGRGSRIGIHIADPAAFVEPGGSIDAEALSRGATHYLPDRRLPMLPPPISEDAASLVEGEERPALTFLVELDGSGEIVGYDIARSVIRARARLDYDRADAAIAEGEGPFAPMLRALAGVADLREAVRVTAGAIRVNAPEVDVHVDRDGRIVLDRGNPRSPAHRIVSESMILAGILAARFCIERGLPAIYRRQPAPDRPPVAPGDGLDDLVWARRLRRAMRRGEVGLEPGPHYGLGVTAYAQATSPLRRYQDLATHRQIVSMLEGGPAVYDVERLQRIAATTESAEADGRRAERASDRYWLLRHLERHAGETVDAVVVEIEPRPVVVLEETLIEEPVFGLAGVGLGDRIRVRVERVNPRADLLVLRL